MTAAAGASAGRRRADAAGTSRNWLCNLVRSYSIGTLAQASMLRINVGSSN
jgi:hypothetical protein